MAFWSSATLDPKRQYKFKVKFDRLGTTQATYLAQSADRPIWTVSDGTKVDFLDKSFHYPGKVTWNQVKIKFVDSTGADGTNVSREVYRYLTSSGYRDPGTAPIDPTQFGTVGKAAAARGNNVEIHVLDSAGTTVDRWTLNNAFITVATLNNLDYAAEAILTAEFTFRYDWADYTDQA